MLISIIFMLMPKLSSSKSVNCIEKVMQIPGVADNLNWYRIDEAINNPSILEGWTRESLEVFISFMPENTVFETENGWMINGQYALEAMTRVYAANGREKEIGSALFQRDVARFISEIAMMYQLNLI